MKKIIYIIILAFSFSYVNAQSIFTSNPTLNAGGYINDILEDTLNNKIYIAGNFTSVNGNARRNIARFTYSIITNSFSLDAWNPLTAMAGEIRCLAKYGNDLHFGGNFTSVNGNTAYSQWSILNLSTNTLGTFQPDAGGAINEINDFELEGNQLYVAGQSILFDDGSNVRYNFGVFTLSSNNAVPGINPQSVNPSFSWGGIMEVVRLKLSGNRIYICGRNFGGFVNDGIAAFDKTSITVITTFNPTFTFEQVIDCETFEDKVYVVNSKIWPGGESVLEIDANTSALTIGAIDASASGTPFSIAIYKDYLFVAGIYTFLQGNPHNYLGAVHLSSQQIPKTKVNWIPSPNAGLDSKYALHVWRNKLYVSDNNLTNISSSSVTGFAVYCLEPLDAVTLSVSTPNVCPLQTFNYSIQSVPYAFGYDWWFTGTDATITGNGTQNITISFGANATSGILYVSPRSRCSLYSDTLAFPITVNPLPDADAGLDSTLNCVRLLLDLQGNSASSPVNYQWAGPNAFTSSLQNPGISSDGSYILTVTNSVTGCEQKDTVIISQDTLRPDVILPIGTFTLTCADTSLFLEGNSNTIPTSLYWRKFNGAIYSNPFYADTIGQYFLVATNTRNGCKDSSDLIVSENRVSPDIGLTSHDDSFLVIDTLTCLKDTIEILGNSITNNTIFSWQDTTGNTISTINNLTTTEDGAFSFIVTDTINGCTSELFFVIAEYKTPPQLSLPSGINAITCSNDSVLLDGNSLTPNTNLEWSGPNGFTSNNPAIVSDTGIYILTATRMDNGCATKDSLEVELLPIIELEISGDTLICAGDNTQLEVTVTGNFTSLDYSWSGSSLNAPIILVNPISSTTYFITVSDGSGCTGTDSIEVEIPSAITDSILTFAACDSTIGEIQVYASGGIPPYEYSLDTINFQTSSVFYVPFGNYTITIKDSLGCVKETYASVNDQTAIPEPDFLAATTSFIGDTIVLIDISNPEPDTLEWNFPTGTNILLNHAQTPWIILPDTGAFQITLKGTYSNCTSEKIKTIFVREQDSAIANFYNLNGIDTILISPNPNSGIFDLEILLHRKQDFSVLIYDINGFLHFDDYRSENDTYFNTVQLGNLQNGTYLIRVIAEFDAKSVYFIIQH